MAAIVVMMIGTGVIAGRRAVSREQVARPAAAVDTPSSPAEQRQLQFATPGGTRIIWVFNPEFDLNETTP
jgi:hypothetical protein